MTTTPQQDQDGAGALLAEYLRASRDMIASQRDVMLAFLASRQPGRGGWAPTADLVPNLVVPALAAETRRSAAPVSPAPMATPIAGGGSRAFGTNTSNTVYAATQTTALTMTDTTPDAAAKPIQ